MWICAVGINFVEIITDPTRIHRVWNTTKYPAETKESVGLHKLILYYSGNPIFNVPQSEGILNLIFSFIEPRWLSSLLNIFHLKLSSDCYLNTLLPEETLNLGFNYTATAEETRRLVL
jgi:hypothetical protein